MIKKLSCNKGSSTLTIAIILIILLSSMALITTLIIGRNAEISSDRVRREYNILILENEMYERLNDKIFANDEDYTVTVTGEEEKIIEISNGDYYVTCTVVFEDDGSYIIKKWGKGDVRDNS